MKDYEYLFAILFNFIVAILNFNTGGMPNTIIGCINLFVIGLLIKNYKP